MARRGTGDDEAAQDLYEKALEIWKERGDLTWQADILNNLGVLHHLRGEYEQAATAFEQGLECARRSGYLHSEALLLTSLGDLYAELGEFEIARHAYEKAEDIARQTSDQFLITYSLLSQAGVARASGIFDRARLLLDEVYAPVKEHNSNYEIGLFELECGRLELSSHSPLRAIPHLESAVESFRQGSRILETGWSHLWLAAACNQVGDVQAARLHIKETVKLDGKGYHSLSMAAFQVRPWLDNGLGDDPEVRASLARLLSRAEMLQSKLPSVRKRLRRLTSTVPLPPPHLDIRAFGKAQVRVNGKLVTNTDWQARSVRELFFYFLHASDTLTKEQIGADLWPEVTPRQLKLRFKNNLYRLRRAVGPETILWDKDLYRFNQDLDYEYDVETFKTQLGKARAAKGVLERIQHYQEAVDQIKGPYLNDFESTWILPERERLEQDYLRALLSLAKLLLQIEKNEEALQICEHILARDACLEEAHRFAMRIYDRLGNHTAVSRQYRVCQRALRTELGVDPSPETEALFRRLTA
jgi:LuxR family maltose regulon positive regulatory protein